MRMRKFGSIRAKDCKGLIIRLPDDVRERIEATTGKSAALALTSLAITIYGGSTDENRQANKV